MKKSILAIALLTMSAATIADEFKIGYAWGDPTFTIKAGRGDDTTAITLSLETEKCNKYALCVNPYFMRLDTEVDDVINNAIGFDVMYKTPKKQNNGFYIVAGVGAFAEKIQGGERLNAHIGIGMELNNFVISIDAYGSNDNPLTMGNVGYRF